MRKAIPISRGKGFTLIELLIVIAIIGILVGIVVPTYQSSVRKANEAAAVTTLNAIRVAQAKYTVDHKGQYGTFRELFEGYLDKRFNYEKPHNRGYVFVITLVAKSEDKAASFSVNANPGTVTRDWRNRQELLLHRPGEWNLL